MTNKKEEKIESVFASPQKVLSDKSWAVLNRKPVISFTIESPAEKGNRIAREIFEEY